MKMIKLIMMLSVLAFTCPPIFAGDGIPHGYFADQGYDSSGAYVEELVKLPVGATVAEYQSALVASVDVVDSRKSKGLLMLAPMGTGGGLVYTICFGEFSEVFNPVNWPLYQVAQNGGAVALPEEPGIVERSIEFTKANPWPVGIGAFLLLDYVTGNGIDAFGVFAKDSDAGRPTVNVGGQNNSVTITDNTNSGNDNSNRPATAAPFFPPQTNNTEAPE